MGKATTNLISLTLLLILSCLGLGSRVVRADDPPTQAHQRMHKMDYTPARLGTMLLGQPLVHVKINGTVDATFLVDTGSNNCLINAALAKRLALPLHPTARDFWKGHEGQAMTTEVPSFQVGSVTAINAPFLVLDTKSFHPFKGTSSKGGVDGVIGANMLEKSAIYLDSSQRKFGFCLPGGVSPQQLSQIGMPSPYVLSLTTNAATNQWFVRTKVINGSTNISENLLLDTGTDTTEVSDQLAEAVHLKPTGQIKWDDFYGSNIVSTSRIEALQLGDLVLRNFPIKIQSGSTNSLSSLGMDILSNYRVFIDFPAKKMYLQPNTAAVPAITIGPTPAVPAMPAK